MHLQACIQTDIRLCEKHCPVINLTGAHPAAPQERQRPPEAQHDFVMMKLHFLSLHHSSYFTESEMRPLKVKVETQQTR